MTQELAAVPGEAGQRRLSDAVTRVVAAVVELADVCAQNSPGNPLIDAIVADPPAEPGLVARLARSAGWRLPARVAVAVLDSQPRPPHPHRALPDGVLADLARPEPRLVLPDPDGPGRPGQIDRAVRRYAQGRGHAAIGPAVPLAAAARSLRWARQALGLARRGIIAAEAAGGPVRAADHLSTLLLLADEDLARTLLGDYLAPLARLRPGQRDRIAETMLAWLQFGENAAEVAHHMHVHPQTVRYRLRQIQELFSDQLRDPDRRLDLQLALRARRLLTDPAPR
jgi:PucR C-terminal helix-turn-helix domain